MPRKKGQKAISVDISDSEHEFLLTYSKKQDLTISQIIRRLIRILSDDNKKPTRHS